MFIIAGPDLPPGNCTKMKVSFPWFRDYFKTNQGGVCEATVFGVPDFIRTQRG